MSNSNEWPQQLLVNPVEYHADGASCILELTIPEDIRYFSGHFDQAPILPGVVQIHWAIALGKQHLSCEGDFKQMEAIKFQQIIAPNSTVTLSLQYQ
ncbi:MAG: hypothetical protein ACN2B6_12665, partial [Rickettsiales bacterium]